MVWLTAGTLHGLIQLVIVIACCWIIAQQIAHAIDPGSLSFVVAFTIAMAVVIHAVGGVLFGANLLVSNLAMGLHEQEAFSCQAIEQFKSFLRICIKKDGATIYPIGLRNPAQRWKPAPSVTIKSFTLSPKFGREDVLRVPEHTTRIYDPAQPLSPHLIELPIRIQ